MIFNCKVTNISILLCMCMSLVACGKTEQTIQTSTNNISINNEEDNSLKQEEISNETQKEVIEKEIECTDLSCVISKLDSGHTFIQANILLKPQTFIPTAHGSLDIKLKVVGDMIVLQHRTIENDLSDEKRVSLLKDFIKELPSDFLDLGELTDEELLDKSYSSLKEYECESEIPLEKKGELVDFLNEQKGLDTYTMYTNSSNTLLTCNSYNSEDSENNNDNVLLYPDDFPIDFQIQYSEFSENFILSEEMENSVGANPFSFSDGEEKNNLLGEIDSIFEADLLLKIISKVHGIAFESIDGNVFFGLILLEYNNENWLRKIEKSYKKVIGPNFKVYRKDKYVIIIFKDGTENTNNDLPIFLKNLIKDKGLIKISDPYIES